MQLEAHFSVHPPALLSDYVATVHRKYPVRVFNAASLPLPHAASMSDYSQLDMLGVGYKAVYFGAGQSPGSPNW